MTDPGTVTVQPEWLYRHAATVEAVADRIEQATAAGRHVRLDAGSYGQLLWVLPQLLNQPQLNIELAGASASTTLNNSATILRTAAAGYASANTDARLRMTGVDPTAPA